MAFSNHSIGTVIQQVDGLGTTRMMARDTSGGNGFAERGSPALRDASWLKPFYGFGIEIPVPPGVERENHFRIGGIPPSHQWVRSPALILLSSTSKAKWVRSGVHRD